MNKLDYVLDFCKEFAKDMLVSGAHIERVNLQIEKLCHMYGLHDVTCANLSTRISISAKDENQNYSQRQTDVPPLAINLERLKKLNHLYYRIKEEMPDASTLRSLLSAITTNDFPMWAILLGNIVAMLGLGRTFGGTWPDLLIICINTLAIFFGCKLLEKIKLNKIILNFVMMFFCSLFTLGMYKVGFVHSFFIVLITNTFLLIPGIPMINCARNFLCGSEANGVIELLKVFLEVCTIVAGIAGAYFFFGDLNVEIINEFAPKDHSFLDNVELTFLTLMATTGFSIGFNIHFKDLPFAMIGGVIIRICYIAFQAIFPEYRLFYCLLASFFAALYSEILAITRKNPSTLYLYPSIIPLIPGDLICLVSLGVIWQNTDLLKLSADLAFALIGISFGFVVCSTVVHYVRKFKFKKTVTESETKQ